MLPIRHETRYFFRTDAPIVYFGSSLAEKHIRVDLVEAVIHAADGNRATLRIEKPQFRGRAVLLACDDAAEGIFRFDHDDVARIDREYGLGIGPVDIMKIALCRDGQLVALPGLTFGKSALRHDRVL